MSAHAESLHAAADLVLGTEAERLLREEAAALILGSATVFEARSRLLDKARFMPGLTASDKRVLFAAAGSDHATEVRRG